MFRKNNFSKSVTNFISMWIALFSALLFLPSYSEYSMNLDQQLYFCTSADSKFFPLLLNLIGSIHKLHNNDLGQIAVFDLGFTKSQHKTLTTIEKVKVYDVELTNPNLLKPLPKYPGSNILVRGLYAWKPVVMKQALDMFPYIMYVDAGMILLRPFNDIFDYIKQHGYLLVENVESIAKVTTCYLIDKFNLRTEERHWILNEDTRGFSAGFQGLTRALYDDYILPMYEYSKDLRNFVDDGTSAGGLGTARHDQALFNIQARLLGLTLTRARENTVPLDVHGKKIFFQITNHYNPHDSKSYIVFARWRRVPDYKQYIRYKQHPKN